MGDKMSSMSSAQPSMAETPPVDIDLFRERGFAIFPSLISGPECQALREEITHRDGRVVQSNFSDYPVTRMEDAPDIHIQVVSTDNKPTGVGEDGVPLTGATIGNAFYAMTGVRLRELPMTPARVLAALSAGHT